MTCSMEKAAPFLRRAAAVLALSALPANAFGTPVLAGYYMSEMPVARIPVDELTHVIYAFGEPGPDNRCRPPSPDQIRTFAQLRELRKRNPGLHVTISIGGWGAAENYSDVALTAASRAAFATSCIKDYIVDSGFEGIDIDWEFPVHGGVPQMHNRPSDRRNVTLLLQELRSRLDALGNANHEHYLLTIAVPAGRWQTGGAYDPSDSYDLAAVARTVDWINVMTYDMNTELSPVSNFNTPLDADPFDPQPPLQRRWNNLSGAVRYFKEHGVPANKIVLGMAFYGRGFRNVSSRRAGLYSKFNGIYDETPWPVVKSKMLPDPAWQKHWSSSAQAPWIYNAKQHIFFSYDDPESMKIKADFARRQGLRGTMFWVLGEDDSNDSLLKALNR